MLIKYGLANENIDVTNICMNKLKINEYIIIPSGDNYRGEYFSDPLPNILKSVFIIDDSGITTEYDSSRKIYINLKTNEVNADNISSLYQSSDINKTLNDIHSKLILRHGSFLEELPEQKIALSYLTGNEKVLEIGGNIGRNSLIISYILGNKNNNNLLVLESDNEIFNKLKENRDLNNMNFLLENSALSNRKLIQSGWITVPSDTLMEGYKPVNTITFNEIKSKYNIDFDTLVLDCEGAFYYILLDMPEILENINLIIMENDYTYINHKNFIDSQLKTNNFYVDYSESGGWGPCYENFYEVWKKKVNKLAGKELI